MQSPATSDWTATPAPASTDWTADFSSSLPAVSLPQSGGLFDIDFSAGSIPTQVGGETFAAIAGMTEGLQGVNFSPPEGCSMMPPTNMVDTTATPGDRLRESLLNGTGAELNRLFEQSNQPPKVEPATPADRFSALQSNLGSLFSTSQQTWGSGSHIAPLSNMAALPPIPSCSNMVACPPITNGLNSMAALPPMPNGWHGAGQPIIPSGNQLPAPMAVPTTFSPPVGAPTNAPFPQMSPSQHIGQMNNAQLAMVQGFFSQAMQAQGHPHGMHKSGDLITPSSFPVKELPAPLDEPLNASPPPKERPFGDLLLHAFSDQHPINSLSVAA
jgi:hypothetical protein